MAERIWELSKQHDPLGMTWGPGVMRAPTRTYWGWNAEEAQRIKVPTLVMLGEFDELNAVEQRALSKISAPITKFS